MWVCGYITLPILIFSGKINQAITTHSYVFKHPGVNLVKFPRCKKPQDRKSLIWNANGPNIIWRSKDISSILSWCTNKSKNPVFKQVIIYIWTVPGRWTELWFNIPVSVDSGKTQCPSKTVIPSGALSIFRPVLHISLWHYERKEVRCVRSLLGKFSCQMQTQVLKNVDVSTRWRSVLRLRWAEGSHGLILYPCRSFCYHIFHTRRN